MLSNKSNKELVEAGHQFAKALDADMPLTDIAKLVSALSTRLDCAIVRGDELQQKLDTIGRSAQWKPEICPITRRPFFMWIEHPSDGMVPTYGGPLDSYTIPTLDSDGEFCCERFDHDEGCWVDSECVGVRLTNDQEPEIDTAYLNSVRADAVSYVADHIDSLQRNMLVSSNSLRDYAVMFRSGTHDTADKAG